MAYQADLQDPRWQRKRLEIFQRDDFQCVRCGDKDTKLAIHHRSYHGKPWECPDVDLETLCDPCHHEESDTSKGFPTLLALRQMIHRAHAAKNWDEVWRLCHLREFEE
jgi:5-methylcytosine-specific restriction endonuclease McrA